MMCLEYPRDVGHRRTADCGAGEEAGPDSLRNVAHAGRGAINTVC
jgi:hypothetical protein